MNILVGADEIKNMLIAKGFSANHINLADSVYVLPTEESIKKFGERYYQFLVNNGLGTWVQEIWDCDDFALLAKSLASIDNAIWKKQAGNDDCSLGFGIAWVIDSYGGHAINAALYKDPTGKLDINFYEPQIQNNPDTKEPYAICLEKLPLDSFRAFSWCYF